jgi:hypothetical protein
MDDFAAEQSMRSGRTILGKLADLLDRNGISLDEIGRIHRVNLWQGFHRDVDGNAQVVDLAGIQLSPKWAEGPEWPVVQPGRPVRLPPRRVVGCDRWPSNAVVLPDMQIGYYRLHDDTLEPTHDEAALAVALEVVKATKPSLVVLVGDNLDLPEFGRYRLSPAFARTTQAAIDRATLMAGQVRDAAPAARIVWLAGNHEERLSSAIIDNATAAFGLRQGRSPESWPVLSIPHLCRLDDFDIEYRPGYPAADVWITERLRVIHGDRVKGSGSTADKYLGEIKSSVVYGHVHRIERAHRTRRDHDGPREVMAASPGCLARIDGAVPSTKQGIDLDGRPLVSHENWQQGLAVVPFDESTGEFDYEQVRIDSGRAMWRGRLYGPSVHV